MINTSGDVLNISLAVGFILLAILLAIAILYLIFILRDVSKTTYYLRDTIKKVNDFVYKPIMMANSVIEKIQPILEKLQKRGEEMAENAVKEVKKKRGRPRKK